MINAFIINRNLVTTLKKTVDFLKQEPRIQIHIIDNDSTYEPCLKYYDECGVFVHYMNSNEGHMVGWSHRLAYLHNDEPFIITDSDCTYDYIPSNWLDVMLEKLRTTDAHKCAFSIRIDDVPNTKIGEIAKAWEKQFWDHAKLNTDYYRCATDTTFALYRPRSGFSYDSARLLPPYTIKHVPFYLPDNNLDEEWAYYRDHASAASTWMNKRKAMGI